MTGQDGGGGCPQNDRDLPRINRELGELWQVTGKKLGDTPTDRQFQEVLLRYRNKTPDWVPFEAERINVKPKWNRGRKESVKSVDKLQQLGLVGHPSTYRESQKSEQALEIWDKGERICQWILSNSPDAEIRRVAPGKEGASPDFIVDGITVDGKTVNPQKLEQRGSEGSYQAQVVVVGLRGASAPNNGVRERIKSAVRNHEDRLDVIVVITDYEPYFWEGARS